MMKTIFRVLYTLFQGNTSSRHDAIWHPGQQTLSGRPAGCRACGGLHRGPGNALSAIAVNLKRAADSYRHGYYGPRDRYST